MRGHIGPKSINSIQLLSPGMLMRREFDCISVDNTNLLWTLIGKIAILERHCFCVSCMQYYAADTLSFS